MFRVCTHMLQFAVMTKISAAWLVYMLHLKFETMLVNLWLPQRTAGGRFNYVYSLPFFNGGVYKLSYGNLQNTEVLKRWQDQVLRIQKDWKVRIKVDHTTLTEPSAWMHLKITYPIGKSLAPSLIPHLPAGQDAILSLQCLGQAHFWAGLVLSTAL